MAITETEFEQLPKHEQNYNWAKFIKSRGGERKLTQSELDNLYKKYFLEKKPLKVMDFAEARR